MPIKNPEEFNLIAWLYILLVSVFGACSRYVYEMQRKKVCAFRLVTLLGQVFIALFGGLLVVAIATHFSLEDEVAGGIAGLAGWGGAEFIKKITNFIYKKLGIDDDKI